MKRKAIGEISRGAGFPAAIREVQESNEPIVITKGSEPVVILFPCTPEFERLLLQMEGFSKVMQSMRRGGHSREATEYLVHQAIMGMIANGMLVEEGKGAQVKAIMEKMLASFTKDLPGDSALVGTNTSTGQMGDTRRRRKSPASS